MIVSKMYRNATKTVLDKTQPFIENIHNRVERVFYFGGVFSRRRVEQ